MHGVEISIVFLIISAVFAVLHNKWSKNIALTLASFSLIAIFILVQIVPDGSSFVFGNFLNTVGIQHKLGIISCVLVSLICPISLYTLHLNKNNRDDVFFIITIIFSVLIISITNDLFNLYIFLELSAICMYILCGKQQDQMKQENTLEYLLLGGVASTFIVLSIEIIYVLYRSLNVSVIFETHLILNNSTMVLLKIAMTMLILASFLKLGVFPFTLWVKKIYTTCPISLLPFYGSVMSGILVYILMIFLYKTIHMYEIIAFCSNIVTPFCVATILVFSLLAVKEEDLRVILGYSTLTQVAYAYLCIVTPNLNTLTGGILHIVHNMIVKIGMFAIVLHVCKKTGVYKISSMEGIGKFFWIGISFCIFAASLVGIPCTSGFITKFYMIQGMIEEKRFIVVMVFIVGTVLNIMYMWKIIVLMYFKKNEVNIKINNIDTIFIVLIAMVVVIFGFATQLTVDKTQSIAIEFLQSF